MRRVQFAPSVTANGPLEAYGAPPLSVVPSEQLRLQLISSGYSPLEQVIAEEIAGGGEGGGLIGGESGGEGSEGGEGGKGGCDGGDGGSGRPTMLSAVSFELLRSALARLALVKSMVPSPYVETVSTVSFEPRRSALARLASLKSMVA